MVACHCLHCQCECECAFAFCVSLSTHSYTGFYAGMNLCLFFGLAPIGMKNKHPKVYNLRVLHMHGESR